MARVVYVEHGAWLRNGGVSDDASLATVELGRRALEIVERETARALLEFHRRAKNLRS